ncbi:protein ETHYLENE-INSENSITIVE 2-like isoform X2 [Zingiber officinale]|uniref:protein ETHYLENE-INSENSITIVE 2-like isoform X2 n=1 Tax=Zingiber officinale TaxID=94328 RepID=UPI001C4BFA71|nr:protein ETHYLENE-INSENSITIVE 2-like isoform X2 [Zingiber officinale]
METAGHIASHLLPSIGPALVISVGYIDLGKWVVAVESGIQFGYDLMLFVLFFNLTAIFCQYLATCVGMVTQKNLAQICSEEYSRLTCMILGVQVALSMITSELTMILGIANGINLFTGVDLATSVCLATLGAVFLPLVILLQKKTFLNASMGALFHDHFFAIVFIFTSIFLVNYTLMSSAAVVFSRTNVMFSFQDVSLLMDQVFRTPIAPVAIFLVLLFSSQITSLTYNVGGRLILHYLFGAKISSWVHHLLVRSPSIVVALCCAKCAGPAGIYQLFIFCQIVQAMLLPSSVVSLFRVASSSSLMGSFKLSLHMKILALFAFFGIFASNIIFIKDMLLGNTSWVNNIGGATGITREVFNVVILLLSCISIVSTFHLAITPLNSESGGPETKLWTSNVQKYRHELTQATEDIDHRKISSEENQFAVLEPALGNSVGNQQDKLVVEVHLHPLDTPVHTEDQFLQSVPVLKDTAHYSSLVDHAVKAKSFPDTDLEIAHETSSDNLSDPGVLDKFDKGQILRDVSIETDYTDKSSEGTLELEESFSKPISGGYSVNSSAQSAEGKSLDNDYRSLSRLSGLGRGSRRQLAVILDEFWGCLFDFHGNLTQEAMLKKYDVLLGIDTKVAYSMGYNSPNGRSLSSLNFMGITPSSHDVLLENTLLQRSSGSLCEPIQRPYSSLHMPQFSEDRDFQPATIHGYQMASHWKGNGAGRNYLSSYTSQPQTTIKSISPLVPSLRDSVLYAHRQSGLGFVGSSVLQSPIAPRVNRGMLESSYYDHSLIEPPSGSVGSSAYAKKYHSSPDISAVISACRNSLLSEMKKPIGPRSSLGQMTLENSQYNNILSGTGIPLAFDQISPTKLHDNVFSLQSSMNQDAKSLWSIQPFELSGVMERDQTRKRIISDKPRLAPREIFSYSESESKLLHSLRFCIQRLLNLEGSDWLFRSNGGSDEELINQVALNEKSVWGHGIDDFHGVYSSELQYYSSTNKFTSVQRDEETNSSFPLNISKCGDDCIWRASLVVSFGVWCVRRILDLSLVESRPELWGKYTYVLNRLQGILELAFLKPRFPLAACLCFEGQPNDTNNCLMQSFLDKAEMPVQGSFTTSCMILESIKDVEIAVASRKGRTGTAAGDIAFPKGKENLASVLKRYKRRLSN